MFHYVYIIENQKKELYVGKTVNLKKRLLEHNNKKTFSTRKGEGWRYIYFEAHLNSTDTDRREKYLKTTQGSRAIKMMMREYLRTTKVEKDQISTTWKGDNVEQPVQ